jgi:hypothetical protein
MAMRVTHKRDRHIERAKEKENNLRERKTTIVKRKERLSAFDSIFSVESSFNLCSVASSSQEASKTR